MPLYEWKCPKCSHVFDESISLKEFDEGKKVECPKCKEKSERVLTATRTANSSWGMWKR